MDQRMKWHTKGPKVVGNSYLVTIEMPGGARFCHFSIRSGNGWLVYGNNIPANSRIVAFAPLPLAYDGELKMSDCIAIKEVP